MTCTAMMNNFDVLVRSQGIFYRDTFPERQVQLTELMVKPKNQIQVNMRWNPATAAVEDVDDTMLDERLRDMKELIWKRYGSK